MRALALGRNTIGLRAALIVAGLVAANAAVWCATWSACGRYGMLLSMGWLAYGFGLRHAVDADHISAIDNTTRKLMQEGKRPLTVGLFFSLGHSTVVVLLCAALAAAASYVQHRLPMLTTVGGEVGTVISCAFLYIIGLANFVVFWGLFVKLREGRQSDLTPSLSPGRSGADGSRPNDFLAGSGLLVRILRPVLRLVRHSWQMYFVGFLFGLGFDTASEIGILALSARTGQSGIPFDVIMLLPVLFTVGMCLIDTLDGILMAGAYGWALADPPRKMRYNAGITCVSVIVALGVGTHELLGMLNIRDLPNRPFWNHLDDNLGFYIIGLFMCIWGASVLAERVRQARAA